LECFICSQCGSDPVFADQARRNHARITDARRRAEGLLTGAEIRALREGLGMTQAEAGELIGGGPMAFSKYERGEVTQSAGIDNFLRVLAVYPFIVDTLRGWQTNGSAAPGAGEYQTVAQTAPVRRSVARRLLAGTHNVILPDCWKTAA